MLSPMDMSSSDSEVHITVDNALTVTPNSGRKYTSYLISVKTTSIAFSLHESRIRRRFSEFVWLRSWLSKYHREIPVPDLPPKKYFGQQFQESVIEERCIGLKNFLRQVVTFTHYLSDSAVHLFLQTELSVDDITMTVEGKSGKTVLETIMDAGKMLSPLESSMDSGTASSSGSSDRETPGQLDFSKSVSSLPHHMIFSPTRPDSPILSFIPGSADSLDGKASPDTSGKLQQPGVNLDLNDSGNALSLSTEDTASALRSGNNQVDAEKTDEEQKRKVSFSAEVTVAQVVSSPNVQGGLVQA